MAKPALTCGLVKDFPALKVPRALRLLRNVGYAITSQTGFHIKLEAEGRETIIFSWTKGATVPPRALRHLLIKKAKLTDEELTRVLKGGRP